MANIYKGTLGLIGNTPLIEAVNLEKAVSYTHLTLPTNSLV